jgi:hypothetical protein
MRDSSDTIVFRPTLNISFQSHLKRIEWGQGFCSGALRAFHHKRSFIHQDHVCCCRDLRFGYITPIGTNPWMWN